jgi:hypothetical protein
MPAILLAMRAAHDLAAALQEPAVRQKGRESRPALGTDYLGQTIRR